MDVSKLVQSLIGKCIIEFKKKENLDKIHADVIDPIIYHSLKKLYPYIILSSVIFVLTFVLVIATLLIIIMKHYK